MKTNLLKNHYNWIIAVGVVLLLCGLFQLRLVDNGLDLPDGRGQLKTGAPPSKSNVYYSKEYTIEGYMTWGILQDRIGLRDDQLRDTFKCTRHGHDAPLDIAKLREAPINDKAVKLVLKSDACPDKP